MSDDRSRSGRFVPRAAPRTRLLVAALAWSATGLALAAAGVRWSLMAPRGLALLGLAAGTLLGVLKGRLVLARAARRNAVRLLGVTGARCVFGFFPWSGWCLVPLMMAAGFALRHSALPRPLLGAIYVAIGAALLIGSASLWRAVRRDGPASEPH